MADDGAQELKGPDLKSGVDPGSLAENSPLLGHFEGEAVRSAIVCVRRIGDRCRTVAW